MESADDFLAMSDAMSSNPESPALPLTTPFVSGLDQYLQSTLFHASLSPPMLSTPSLESTPSPEERKEVKKRERKKQPKLECCTDEQIAVCFSSGTTSPPPRVTRRAKDAPSY